jgi:glycosidase
LDRLVDKNVFELKQDIKKYNHSKMVHFIENHDEERSLKKLGPEKIKSAAIIIGTLPGISLFYDGQLVGKEVRIPVELGREPFEEKKPQIQDFYSLLLEIKKNQVFKQGWWKYIEALNVENGHQAESILSWQWTLEDADYTLKNYKLKSISKQILIVANYSENENRCRLKLDTKNLPTKTVMTDLMTGEKYTKYKQEISDQGLVVILKPWESHIFYF